MLKAGKLELETDRIGDHNFHPEAGNGEVTAL